MSEEFYKNPKLTVNNGSIVIYYYYKNVCRYPTGYSVSSQKSKNGKFLEWDYKNNFLKPSSEDYDTKSKELIKLLDKSKDIIKSKYEEQKIVLTGSELQKYLKSDYVVKKLNYSLKIREHYEKFLEIKRERFIKKPKSLVDYISLRNLFESFEYYYNLKITTRDFNEDFVNNLISFTKVKHPKQIERDGILFKFKTKGQLIPNTLRKRLDNLKEFKDYLVKNKIILPYDFIEKKRSELIIPPKKSITLTIDEIHDLYNINFKTKKLNEIKDLFVIICLTGLRWSDVENFDRRFIIIDGEKWTYETVPTKTEDSSSIECYIPLCKLVQTILKKYNMDLQNIIPSNKDFNEKLKDVCKESNLFNNITRIKNKETKSYMYRYELITAHKGRDTFITNLIDVVPINELMKYTGHTKVSTLMKYVDKSRKVSHEYIKIFDNEK